jgi:anti-anti-sigma factor
VPFIGDPRTEFSVTAQQGGKAGLITVRGDLTIASVPRLQPTIEAAVRSHQPVVVDLAEVPFMDSQGLFALLVLRQRLRAQSCGLAIVREPDGAVAMTFRVSGTADLFEIRASRRAAMAAARRAHKVT